MRFLPYERATLLTSLSPTEVARRLRPLIAPPGFALFAPRRPLRGTFDTGALCLGMPSDPTLAPNPSGALAGALLMLAFAVGAPLLMLAVFWSEARATGRLLSDLLEAEPPVR